MRRVAALVAAALALGLAACGIPTSGAPQTISRSDAPYQLLVPPPTTTLPQVTAQVTIYLVDSTTGHLVPVLREVSPPARPTAVLAALLEGPIATETAKNYVSYLSGSPGDVDVTVSGGVATVNFSTNPIQVVGTSQIQAIAQVVYTATEASNVTGVLFEISGEPIDVPNGADVLVSTPVTRAMYAPQAPLIDSTTPSS